MSNRSLRTECGKDTIYKPEKCCLPGVKCITPCYRPEIGNDSYPCVDKNGDPRSGEMIKLLSCKRGVYNPDECCEPGDIGPQCLAPCKDGKNCVDMEGDFPIEKAIKQYRARKLMEKLKNLKPKKDTQSGAAYLYTKIVNPKTGRKVNINGTIGKRVLKNYLNYLKSI